MTPSDTSHPTPTPRAPQTLGLGAMGMSPVYGPSDRGEAIATVHAALDAGITLIDTGDFYGMGHNELLLARGARRTSARELPAQREVRRAARSGRRVRSASTPARAPVKNFLAYSLRRLGTDYVDIYRPARLDPATPIEETVGAIAELVQAGYVRHIGLSEVGAETIRRAAAVHPIADLQIEYSLISRGIEDRILPTCRELGIGITAYGVLSRGLISGHWTRDSGGAGRLPHPQPALPGREPGPQPLAGRGAARDRRRQGGDRRAARHRLGRGAGAGHHAPDRRADRGRGWRKRSASLAVELSAEELAEIEKAVPRGRGGGGPVRRRADGPSGQREVGRGGWVTVRGGRCRHDDRGGSGEQRRQRRQRTARAIAMARATPPRRPRESRPPRRLTRHRRDTATGTHPRSHTRSHTHDAAHRTDC